jgi:hypothetical protein
MCLRRGNDRVGREARFILAANPADAVAALCWIRFTAACYYGLLREHARR